jgi:hypothetical protein
VEASRYRAYPVEESGDEYTMVVNAIPGVLRWWHRKCT